MKYLTIMLGLLALFISAGEACADPSASHSPGSAPVLGRVIPGSTTTVFSISTAGAVTRVSGDAIRITPGSVTSPTITISCGLLNLNSLCALRSIRVTVQPAGATAGARIINLRAGALSGSSYRSGAVLQGQILTFDINPIGLLGRASFPLGMDIQLDAGAQPGAQTFNYTVTVQFR